MFTRLEVPMAENYFIDQTRLNGRVAVVTGAGRGLGKEIALALASAGSDIALMARTESQLEETAREIEACGRKALVIPIDVAKSEEVDHAIERVTQNLGPVDILVNNAGITEQKPLVKITDEDWHRVMGINLDGPFFLCRAVGRRMIERKKGKIINIGSVLGLVGYKRFASYSTSKGALLQFTRSLALEWAKYGINVNAIALGWFLTEMNAEAMSDEKIRDVHVSRIPLGRLGHTKEIGPLVIYLASPASDFMTGSVIVLDGGELVNW
jgi:NAD(P)-dependent dehydrogenase (short-subunit alcohol dehydrogenase family)